MGAEEIITALFNDDPVQELQKVAMPRVCRRIAGVVVVNRKNKGMILVGLHPLPPEAGIVEHLEFLEGPASGQDKQLAEEALS